MNELSLFSGCGGGIYGSKLLGWRTVGYVEYDNYCQAIIAQRIRDGIFDLAPIFNDVRTFAFTYASSFQGVVDVVTAGFPCQPFSPAGHRKGNQDERNMWPATLSIIRAVQPKWCLLENVPGLLAQHGYFGTVLKDLAEAGFDAEWDCLSAESVGAPHKRDRLWILAANTKSNAQRSNSGASSDDCSEATANSDAESYGPQRICRSEGSLRDIYEARRRESSRDDCGGSWWWESEPDVGRVADGMALRRDRLKALGNGQVPRVVEEAWKKLITVKS